MLENRLAEWRRLLRQSKTQARAVLQRVLVGRVTFTPDESGYAFAAPTRYPITVGPYMTKSEMESVAGVIDTIKAAVAPLRARIKALENRPELCIVASTSPATTTSRAIW